MSGCAVMRAPRAKPGLTLKITVVIEPDGDAYHAYCPALEGLHVDGRTVEEAYRNAGEAARVYLASIARHGEELPIGEDLSATHTSRPRVPKKARVRSVRIECPSRLMSGVKLKT